MSTQTEQQITKHKSSFARKLLIALSALVGLLVLTAIAVPLFFDVDKYRPVIVEKANERINGKLELGKLSLSLWGRVHVTVDGLKLTDANGVQVVEVKDASFNLPLMSLLSGRPEVRVEMLEPLLNIIKQKDGKLNAVSLVKEQPAESSTGAGPSGLSKQTPSKTGETEVPAIVMNARLTFLIDHAKLAYKDAITGDAYNVNDLNVRLEDVSPSSEMPFEITANLDLTAQKKIKVTGPVSFVGQVKGTSTSGKFDKATAKATLKLDGAEISDANLFHKAKGVPLGAELEAIVGADSFTVPKLKFHLAQVEVDGHASGKTVGDTTTIDFKAESNRIDIAKLGELSPLVKEYNLNGLVELSVSASGPTDKLGYGANVKFNKIMLTHESLKQPLEVNGALKVATNQIEDLLVKVTAPKDFDMSMSGALQNFMAPKFKIKLVSNSMDLDGLLKASEKAAQNRREQAKTQPAPSGEQGKAAGPTANAVDYNAMFEPLRKMPMAAAAAGTFDFSLKRIKSTGVVISDMQGQLALNNLLLALKDFSLKIFDGGIKGNMSFNARAAKPEVATNITMSGLQTQKMVEQSMPIARNTVKGVISAALNIGGSGLNQSDILENWKGNGSMDIKNAVFSTLDIGRTVKEGVIDKLPPVLKDKVKIPDAVLDRHGEYETVNAKFGLASGVMHINEVNGKAYPSKGLDLKGSGSVRLANYALDMTLDMIDTYNLFRLDEHAKDPRYGHFAVQAKVGGTLFEPKFDYGNTVGKLAEAALKTEGRKRLEEEAKKRLGGNPAVGNVLNKVFGGSGDGNQQPQQKQEAPKPADAVKALKGLFGH